MLMSQQVSYEEPIKSAFSKKNVLDELLFTSARHASLKESLHCSK